MYSCSTIENLFFGNIEHLPSNNEEHEKMGREVAELEEAFIGRLGKEERTLFDKIQESQGNISALENREAFVEGFRLGAKIMLEILGIPYPTGNKVF